MSFRATSQDSRDPNTPQWGYIKVKDPENELCYPAKDKNWNEYMMFVHDTDNPKVDVDSKTEVGGIRARKDLECIMVPATLTIECDKAQVLDLLRKDMDKCKDAESRERYENYINRVESIEFPPGPIKIEKNIPDSTTLWVALVLRSVNNKKPGNIY